MRIYNVTTIIECRPVHTDSTIVLLGETVGFQIQFRSLSERIVDEFLFYREKNPDVQRVKVKTDKLGGKDPAAMARGLGRVFKKKAEEWTARVDQENQLWILQR